MVISCRCCTVANLLLVWAATATARVSSQLVSRSTLTSARTWSASFHTPWQRRREKHRTTRCTDIVAWIMAVWRQTVASAVKSTWFQLHIVVSRKSQQPFGLVQLTECISLGSWSHFRRMCLPATMWNSKKASRAARCCADLFGYAADISRPCRFYCGISSEYSRSLQSLQSLVTANIFETSAASPQIFADLCRSLQTPFIRSNLGRFCSSAFALD